MRVSLARPPGRSRRRTADPGPALPDRRPAAHPGTRSATGGSIAARRRPAVLAAWVFPPGPARPGHGSSPTRRGGGAGPGMRRKTVRIMRDLLQILLIVGADEMSVAEISRIRAGARVVGEGGRPGGRVGRLRRPSALEIQRLSGSGCGTALSRAGYRGASDCGTVPRAAPVPPAGPAHITAIRSAM